SLACAAAVISGIPVQAQQEQAPLMLPEHVQKTLDCMDALMKQPAIADLLLTLGVGQFTPNGKMAMPTPVHLFSNNYATPRDSGAAIAFVNGAAACAGSGAQEDVQITKICGLSPPGSSPTVKRACCYIRRCNSPSRVHR